MELSEIRTKYSTYVHAYMHVLKTNSLPEYSSPICLCKFPFQLLGRLERVNPHLFAKTMSDDNGREGERGEGTEGRRDRGRKEERPKERDIERERERESKFYLIASCKLRSMFAAPGRYSDIPATFRCTSP